MGGGGSAPDAGIPCLLSAVNTCQDETFCYVTTSTEKPNGQCTR